MDVVSGSYLPGDQGLVDKIVYELKSQGIFDQFRKECIADVDTKPAYQNLRQRVEGNVAGFLNTQSWSPDMNKNQVREQLRKNIYESGFLELGVERIVDQVVNPKINSVFHPKVEEVVYKFLGLQRPNRIDYRKEPSKVTITYNDLLPTDLEAVSPGSDILDQNDDVKEDELSNNDTQDNDDGKYDEDESPAFEPLEGQTSSFNIQQEVFTTESRLSDISGVLVHDSNSNDLKVTPMDVCSQDSQISLNGSESRLSIITDEITKMDVCDNSNIKSSLESDNGSEDHTSSDKITTYMPEKVTPVKNIEETKVTEGEHTDKDKKNDDRKHDGQKHESRSNKHKSNSDKHKSKHDKEDKSKRNKDKDTEKEKDTEKNRDKEKSSKHTLSRENSKEYRDSKSSKPEKDRDMKTNRSERDKNDKHKNGKEKSSGDKSDKNKVDKEKSQKSDSYKSDRHKSDKEKIKHKSEREKSESDKLKPKERSEKADKGKNGKETTEKERKEKSDKDKIVRSDKDKVDRSDKEKSDKLRSDKEKAQLDKQKSEKDRTNKGEKSDREKVDKSHKEKSGTDKDKGKSEKNEKNEKDRKDKQSSSRHGSTSSRDKSSSKKEKDSSSKERSKSSNSKPTEKGQNEIKNKESKDEHRSKSSKKDEKHSSHKKPKDKKKDKDDHYSAKDRKYYRRSTDRDSNDGRSSKQVNTSPGEGQSHSHTHKSSQESTGSSNSGSGDSGNSEQLESTKLQENMSHSIDSSSLGLSPEKGVGVSADVLTLKVIKPKFASNFQEARRIMKIRKQLSKLEKHNQLSLASVNTPVGQEVAPTIQQPINADDSPNNGQRSQHTNESPSKYGKNKSAHMKTYSNKNIIDKELIESHSKKNHKVVTEKLKARLNTKIKTNKTIKDALKTHPKFGAKSKAMVKVKWNNSVKPKGRNVRVDAAPSPSRVKKVLTKVNLDVGAKNNSPKVNSEKVHVQSPYLSDEPDQIEEITPPLKDTVITMASWDALEAKLNQELLKVDYNSYESPDCDYSPVKMLEHSSKYPVDTRPLEFESLSKQLCEPSSSKSSLRPQVGSSSQQPQDTTQSHTENLSADIESHKDQADVTTSTRMQDPLQVALHSEKSIVLGECPKGKDPSQLHLEDELVPIENKVSCAEIPHNLQSSDSELIPCQETATNNMSHIPDESIPIDGGTLESQMNEESDASKENIEPYSIKQDEADVVNENVSSDLRTSEDSNSNASIKEANNSEIGKVDDNSKQIEEMKNNLKNLIVNLENVCSKDMQENRHRNHGKSTRDSKSTSIEDLQVQGKNSSNRINQVRNRSSWEKTLHVVPKETKEGTEENSVDSNIVSAASIKGPIICLDQTTKSASTVLPLPDIKSSSEGSDLESDCKFLVPTERSDVYLKLIRNRIDCLEESMAKQQELITRLSNSSKTSPQRGRKRKSPQENDGPDQKRECLSEERKEKLGRRRRATLKAKNTQIYSRADANSPVSTLSPTQLGKSVNSADPVLEIPSKRRRINKVGAQRYTSDDLYKPRPNFNNSRRSKDNSS